MCGERTWSQQASAVDMTGVKRICGKCKTYGEHEECDVDEYDRLEEKHGGYGRCAEDIAAEGMRGKCN